MTERQYKVLFDRLCKPVYFFVRRYIYSHEIAEDITCETFYLFWENQNGFNHLLGGITDEKYMPDEFFKAATTWIYKAVRNNLLNHIRKVSKVEIIRLPDEDAEDLLDDLEEKDGNQTKNENIFFDALIIKCELLDRIMKDIESLPKRCKEVFYLFAIEGYKEAEIADILKIKIDTVRTQVFRARKIMKERLIEDYPQIGRDPIHDIKKRKKRARDKQWRRSNKIRKDGTTMFG